MKVNTFRGNRHAKKSPFVGGSMKVDTFNVAYMKADTSGQGT